MGSVHCFGKANFIKVSKYFLSKFKAIFHGFKKIWSDMKNQQTDKWKDGQRPGHNMTGLTMGIQKFVENSAYLDKTASLDGQ